MKAHWIFGGIVLVLGSVIALPVFASPDAASSNTGSPQRLAKIIPGSSTKTQVKSLLGTPWREVQFNDCGMAMDDQADETWEYRGADANGGYRIHIEFGDNDIVHLVAKIPDKVVGGKATDAKAVPAPPSNDMSM
jgi:hypothetical protein